MPLCASVHSHLTYLLLFSFNPLAVCLKALILECLHFCSTTVSLYHDGCMTLQLGCCENVFARINAVVCKHLFFNVLWLSILVFMRCSIVPMIWATCLK